MNDYAIQNALELAARNGFAVPENLRKEISDLENPRYRIAVVGKYQVGKSTLINRVFLKNNPILLEGFGLATTSICTEVGYGEKRRLEVYDFEGKLIHSVDDPVEDDVRKNTVGEDRQALSKNVSIVRIAEPNENLKSYTFIDTPGIDDPEPELLINTTYRIVPNSDLAILVTEPRMLDETEIRLLRKNLVSDGISRLMVLISFNPKKDDQNAAQRQKIVEIVRSQLINIGLPDVPVRFFCYNNADEYRDLLNTPEKIETELLTFLKVNALPGRKQRIASHLKSYLDTCLLKLSAQIAIADKNETEKAELAAGIYAQRTELAKRCDRLEMDLEKDFAGLARKFSREVTREIENLVKKYKDGINNSDSIEDLKKCLEDMGKNLNLDIAEMFDKKGREVQDEVRLALTRRLPQKSDFSHEWSAFWDEQFPEIELGFLARIPNWIYEILNIISLDMLLPGGFVTAAIIRVIQSKIKLLKNITLAQIALGFMKKQVLAAIDDNFAEIKEGFNAKFSDGFNKIAESVKNELRIFFNAQLDAVETAFKEETTADKTALLNARSEIESAITQL